MKYIVALMVIITIAALNLSTSCQPAPIVATSIAEVASYRRDLPFREDVETPENPAISEAINILNADTKPEELTWRTLTDVDFKDVYIDELDAYYWKPEFGPSVKALEGRDVYLTGYMIPVDYDEDFYVLSRYPFANCFFCGGAGPESVVDLRFKGKTRRYETDERLTFKGRFALNANDVYQMNYILEGAEEYKP